MKSVGLIAGSGQFPMILARQLLCAKRDVMIFAICGQADPELADHVGKVHWLEIYEIDKLISVMKENNIDEAVMAGKVNKSFLIKNAAMILKNLPVKNIWNAVTDRKDDTLLLAVADKFEEAGIHLLASTAYMENFLADMGLMTERSPTDRERRDIDFGFAMAKKCAGLDIGQSVLVKNQAILAVEAIEGTDEAIRRGVAWGGEDVVCVKVSKPHQDLRFDVPVVGEQTLEVMHECHCRVLALEAGQTLIMNKSDFIEKANAYQITVWGKSL